MTLRVLLFSDKRAAERFLRRRRDRVQVLAIVEDDEGINEARWRGAIKKNCNALVLSGLIPFTGVLAYSLISSSACLAFLDSLLVSTGQ